MKIFDCTTFYSEDLMMDVRFNILNPFVHKFIVVESRFSHSGKEKKLNFDINDDMFGYRKFSVFTENVEFDQDKSTCTYKKDKDLDCRLDEYEGKYYFLD